MESESFAVGAPVSAHPVQRNLIRIDTPQTCCGDSWEAAYLRFETPEEEIRKFTRRLRTLGAAAWPRDARIVELFCGRGNGLVALTSLGFRRLEGVDLSLSLLERYSGPATCYLCDCRRLPFDAGSKDILIVQGGLHHLAVLPDDLHKSLREAGRVLKGGGLFVALEPWLTPFLALVHAVCRARLAARLSAKIEALATMNRQEHQTYTQWLAQSSTNLTILEQHFDLVWRRVAWGKLLFVGRKRGAV